MSLLMPHATDPIAVPRAAQIEEVLRKARASHLTPRILLDDQTMELPPEVRDAILDLLQRFAEGHGVIVGSLDSQLTTSQAANLLGISRTYMVRLIDAGRMPVEYRGTHRRVQLKDIVVYMENSRHERAGKLDAIAELSARTGQYDNDEF